MKRPDASTQLWSFAMELEPIVACIRQSEVPAFWAGSVMGSRQGNPNPVASDLPKNERRKGRFRGAILKEAFFLQSPIPKCEGPGQHARVHTGFND
jgi:hypothetical protein